VTPDDVFLVLPAAFRISG